MKIWLQRCHRSAFVALVVIANATAHAQNPASAIAGAPQPNNDGVWDLPSIPPTDLFADGFEDAASLSINDVALAEGNSGTTNAVFTVTLLGAVAGGFTVPVSSVAETATAGSDFTTIPEATSLSFIGTEGETKTIAVPVIGDTTAENNESFQVWLGTPSVAAVSTSDASGVGTILNDDAATMAITSFAPTSGNVTANQMMGLNWSSAGTTLCAASQGGGTTWGAQGTLPPNGTASFAAPATAGTIIFQLSCTDGVQTTNATTQVTVHPAETLCIPLYPNGIVATWASTFTAWPSFGVTRRLSVPNIGYLSFFFSAPATIGQFGTISANDFLGDGDGWGQLSISRDPGCFTPASLGANCVGPVARSPSIGWAIGSSNTRCSLTPGQSYFLNFTFGSDTAPGNGPYCPDGSGGCSADLQNQNQD